MRYRLSRFPRSFQEGGFGMLLKVATTLSVTCSIIPAFSSFETFSEKIRSRFCTFVAFRHN